MNTSPNQLAQSLHSAAANLQAACLGPGSGLHEIEECRSEIRYLLGDAARLSPEAFSDELQAAVADARHELSTAEWALE
jgi:hypothetical protein